MICTSCFSSFFIVTYVPHPHLPSWSDMTESSIDRKELKSAAYKLFNSVLNNKLDEYLSENNIISETQIGFKKKARTTDHMFVLRC